MHSQIEFLQTTLGSHQAVASFLGYTTRQLYNIRKRVEAGQELHLRVETHLLTKVIQLKEQLSRRNTRR